MPSTPKGVRFQWRSRLAPAILLLVICIVFGRTCTFDFTLWDDPQTISQNPLLNPPEPSKVAELWKKPIENLYIPVTYSLWSAAAWVAWLDVPDAHGVHLNPSVFHCLNLLIHLLCSLVVLGLLRRVVKNEWAALAGAALFALHPVQVEAVAWVSGTKDLLYALLSLLVVLSFIRFLEAREAKARLAWYGLGTLLVAAAILAKPTGVVAPLVAVAIASLEARKWRPADLGAVGGWLVVAAAGAVVARLVQTGENAGPPAPPWFRPLIALDALGFYVGKLLWPFHPAIDYGRSPDHLFHTGWWHFTPVIPLALLAALAFARVKRPIWSGVLLFLFPLLPVLGILTFAFQFYSTVADHYLYLPMFGLSLAVAWVFSALTDNPNDRARQSPAVATITLCYFICIATVSFITSTHWQSSRALFEHTLSVNPDSFISHYDLAVLDEGENHLPEAVDHFRSAIALRPTHVPAHAELGSLLLRLGRIDEGLDHWAQSIELAHEQEPTANLAPAYVNVIRTALHLSRTQRAAALLQKALETYPRDPALLQLRKQPPTTLILQSPETN